MEKENILKEEEKTVLVKALKNLIELRRPIYEGYQKFLQKENNKTLFSKQKDLKISMEGE